MLPNRNSICELIAVESLFRTGETDLMLKMMIHNVISNKKDNEI